MKNLVNVNGLKVINQKHGKNYSLYNGDSCEVIKGIPDNSIDFMIYSPPFSNLYVYTDTTSDMGNTEDDDEFFEHFKFLMPELFRILKPGRIMAIHCKDLPRYMNRDGAAGLRDFPGRIIQEFEEYGFIYHSRVTIWKDPVIEMQRTKNHGLLWRNFTERGEVVRQGMADYMIMMRKWIDLSDMPDKQVSNTPRPNDELNQYIGERPPTRWDSERDYAIQVWQKYASPVWYDIRQTRVLNVQMSKDNEDSKHICPLQLDIIERCIQIWTNPGDVVFSPFAGIGSEGFGALKLKRKFIGAELKEGYWNRACKFLDEVDNDSQDSLFDLDTLTVEENENVED